MLLRILYSVHHSRCGFGNRRIWDVCSVGAVVGVVGVVVDLEAISQNRFGTRRARNTTM